MKKNDTLQRQWRELLPRLVKAAPPETILLLFDRHGRALPPPEAVHGPLTGRHSRDDIDRAGVMALALNSIAERMATEFGDMPRQYVLLRSARAAYVVIPWAAGATLVAIINQPEAIDAAVQAMTNILTESESFHGTQSHDL